VVIPVLHDLLKRAGISRTRKKYLKAQYLEWAAQILILCGYRDGDRI
jgi:hypothetical protein